MKLPSELYERLIGIWPQVSGFTSTGEAAMCRDEGPRACIAGAGAGGYRRDADALASVSHLAE